MTILLYKHLGIRALRHFYTNFTHICLVLSYKCLNIRVLNGFYASGGIKISVPPFLGLPKTSPPSEQLESEGEADALEASVPAAHEGRHRHPARGEAIAHLGIRPQFLGYDSAEISRLMRFPCDLGSGLIKYIILSFRRKKDEEP